MTTLEPTRLVPNVPHCAIRLAWLGYRVERTCRAGWHASSIIAKLNSALRRGFYDAETRKRLESSAGYDIATPNTPDDFASFSRPDTAVAHYRQKANISVK